MNVRRAVSYLLFFSIVLVSCGDASPLSETHTPTPFPAKSPTAPVAAEKALAFPTPTHLPPLRFTLPTPGAEPISDWRPPLYPVPWAISPHDHFYFIRPIAANEKNWPLPSYRYGGIFFQNVVHTGIDIPADENALILAAGPGTVIWAGWGLFSNWSANKNDPYGLAVAIRHDFGYENQPLYTIYAHMSKVLVTLGQHVQTGDTLGLVGDTGHATGPHLHFEIRLGENSYYTTRNPELWTAPPQGWGVLAGRVMDRKGKLLNHYPVQITAYPSGRIHYIRTYGATIVNSDEYYQENLGIGDLPAGWYEISILYEDHEYRTQIQIFPGQIAYFSFRGEKGFALGPPPDPAIEDILSPQP
jgi:murein DD-endopeptidase MepM/ murein hydrolase activator NlpD